MLLKAKFSSSQFRAPKHDRQEKTPTRHESINNRMKLIKEYVALIIQTNLAHTNSPAALEILQVFLYFTQLVFFLIEDPTDPALELLRSISKIALVTPFFRQQEEVAAAIGIILLIINSIPSIITIYRIQTKFMKTIDNISRSLHQVPTKIICYHFIFFTWIFYLPSLYFSFEMLLYSDKAFLIVLAILNLLMTCVALLISNNYFINMEFHERRMTKFFTYNNMISQILLVVVVVLNILGHTLARAISRATHGVVLFLQLYEAFVYLPFGFSTHALVYNHSLVGHALIFLVSSLKAAFGIQPQLEVMLVLLLLPAFYYLHHAAFSRFKHSLYSSVENQNQYMQLLYIENIFELSQKAQTSTTKKVELLVKFNAHRVKCSQILCQCRKISFSKIQKNDQIVTFISCLFKSSFSKHKDFNRIQYFETISLKFLTFTNHYKRNGPKTYQELKILFQNDRQYSFYFTTMCQILQIILQVQMQKDEDFNINSDQQRLSNVKLQKANRSERSIVQNLYQMEQAKNYMLPLLVKLSQFKAGFWKSFLNGKVTNYSELEIELTKLQELKNQLERGHQKYQRIFFANGKCFNVQFLKFSALMHLLLFNDAREYIEIEKQCKEILEHEKSMNTFEITNINFFKGSAISLKVAVAIGPNIGRVRNKIIPPTVPRFFGFDVFPDPMTAFLEHTQGNINMLMPDWIQPIHDEMMQNYIRRGFTARIGKYFQTFIKLYDKTLARVQVYLAHNFSPDLRQDFTMIGCVKRLDEEFSRENITQIDDVKRKKYFRGMQYILFDVNGNILGITTGVYNMIRKLQRMAGSEMESARKSDVATQRYRKQSSQISSQNDSEEEHNIHDIKWSEDEMKIDEFYQMCLIWMLLPFISKEIEQTGMEYHLMGQKPSKLKYPQAVDIETSNTIISQKETYMFVPEDLKLFAKQYYKILVKMYEDEQVMTKNYSQASSRCRLSEKSESYENEVQHVKDKTSLFNEKLCSFFYDEQIKNQIMFQTERQSEFRFSSYRSPPLPSSKSSLYNTEDERSDGINNEQYFQDRLQAYTSKISFQAFNPIPIIYSVNYEEYKYKKNEQENKVQMFVVEMIINESLQQNTEEKHKRYLRETIKCTIQSQLRRKSVNKIFSDDSFSPVGSNDEKPYHHEYIGIQNYLLNTHSSKLRLEDNHMILNLDDERAEQQSVPRFASLTIFKEKNNLQFISTKRTELDVSLIDHRSRDKIPDSQSLGLRSKPKTSERNLVQMALGKFSQKKHQQQFFAHNHQSFQKPSDDGDDHKKLTKDTTDKQEIIQSLDNSFKQVNSRIKKYHYPQSFLFQIILLAASLFLIITYVILVSVLVNSQYRYRDCLNTINTMLNLQTGYFGATHALFKLYTLNRFYEDSKNQTAAYFESLLSRELSGFIRILDQDKNSLNQLGVYVSSYQNFDQSQTDLDQMDLFQYLNKLGSNLHQVENDLTQSQNFETVKFFIGNQLPVSELPQQAQKICFYDQQDVEQDYQDILISYMVIIIILVSVLQLVQYPLIKKLIKYQKQILRQVIQITNEQSLQEVQCYEYFERQLKVSIYEWMLVDFVRQTNLLNSQDQIAVVMPTQNNHTTSSVEPTAPMLSQKVKKTQRRLNLSNFNPYRYVLILLVASVIIMAYFIIIFLVIYIISDEIDAIAKLLVHQKQLESNFITYLVGADILAYNQVHGEPIFENLIPTNIYLEFMENVGSTNNDIYLNSQQKLTNILINNDLQNQIQHINEVNVCDYYFCEETLIYQFNRTMALEYRHGLKFLITQVEKVIRSNPHFFEDTQKGEQLWEFLEYLESGDHQVYLDFGCEILLNSYRLITEVSVSLFELTLKNYREALLAFLLTVGSLGLLTYGLMGRLSLKKQKASLEVCITSLYLLSPRRYQQREINLLNKKI